jgi:hypothetical protein
LREEDFARVRRPVDASQGLLYANGEVVFHIVYAVIAAFVLETEKGKPH